MKGRFGEDKYDDDHVLLAGEEQFLTVVDGVITAETLSARALVNHELRSEYTIDCEKGVRRWNRTLAEQGIDVELALPHVGFNARLGRSVTQR